MKHKFRAPSPAKGPGQKNIGGATPAPESPAKAVKTAKALKRSRTPASAVQEAVAASAATPAPASTTQPRYDQGLRFDTPGLRYPVGDTVVLPADEGAKVKLSLASRNNENVANFTANHILQMEGNLNFPTPLPPAAEFDPVYQDFQTKLNTWLSAQTVLRDASTALAAARVQLDSYLNARAAYVQSASNGNTNAIISSGFQVRSARTPVGELPCPTDLKLELNGVPGVMYLSWTPVVKARGYNIQWSYADTLERNWLPYETTTAARYKCTELELGKVYAFRIAAIGGTTGLSDWSAEVVRMAA